MITLAVTGHRPDKLGGDYELTGDLCNKVRERLDHVVCDYRPSRMISGMALGVDTIWAELAVKHEVPLICAVPCYNQHKAWPMRSQDRYAQILNSPNSCLVYTYEGEYNKECMQKRNEWMVNECDILVAVWDGSSGGTANCVKYARSVNKEVILINPTTL